MSFRGALWVARRALHPGKLDLIPEVRTLTLQVPNEPARLLLAAVVSLVPGTVGTGVGPRDLSLHLLDARNARAAFAQVRRVERQVRGIFAEEGF
jgi:multisubunit Na+/H+ antiporter MnhE subunit